MQVVFIKDHTSGIKAETRRNLGLAHARRLKSEGYVEFEEEDNEADTGGSATDNLRDGVTNPLGIDLFNSQEFKVTKKSLTDNPTWAELGIKKDDVILIEKPAAE